MCGNARTNWIRKYGTLKFTLSHNNYSLAETQEALKLSSASITQDDFKKIHLLTLYHLTNTRNPKIYF